MILSKILRGLGDAALGAGYILTGSRQMPGDLVGCGAVWLWGSLFLVLRWAVYSARPMALVFISVH